MSDYTLFLTSEPSFLSGAASIVDMFGAYYPFNDAPTGRQADRLATRADWMAVGEDMRQALATFASDRSHGWQQDR